MRRTQPANFGGKMGALISARQNPRYNNVCEQPYYLKPTGENPFLGTQHDGVSAEYGTGYTVKPIHHLYRFTHNILPENIPRGGLRNPWGKRMHWLEISAWAQMKSDHNVFDALPPIILTMIVLGLTFFHCLRLCVYHPDITWYNLAFPTNKSFVPFVRFNEKHQLDQPTYRYFQNQSEFFFKDAHKRAGLEMDFIVNDPFINHVKEIGRGDELEIHGSMGKGTKGVGNAGRGYLVPHVFEEKSSWYTPYNERRKENPDDTFRQSHGSSTFWSLYTNLWHNP